MGKGTFENLAFALSVYYCRFVSFHLSIISSYASGGEDGFVRIHYFDDDYLAYDIAY
jgi:hypothetical protein